MCKYIGCKNKRYGGDYCLEHFNLYKSARKYDKCLVASCERKAPNDLCALHVQARSKFKLTTQQTVDLYAKTSCEICGKTTNLHVDHDHNCCEYGCPNCIRGILCAGCNTGLGKFKDSVEGLQRAIVYLTR